MSYGFAYGCLVCSYWYAQWPSIWQRGKNFGWNWLHQPNDSQILNLEYNLNAYNLKPVGGHIAKLDCPILNYFKQWQWNMTLGDNIVIPSALSLK